MFDEISIRPYRTSDAPALYEAARESVAVVGEWLPWCHDGYQPAEAEDWLARQVVARERGEEYEFAIVGARGRYLGGVGVNAIRIDHAFANLGYWVRASAMGRGIAPVAVRLAARWAFEHTALTRLEIVVATANVRSQRVAEKAGAQREGVLRERLVLRGVAQDAVMYSLIRGDFASGHFSSQEPFA
jgi:ribosomal-protein-serine acetyltransferase